MTVIIVGKEDFAGKIAQEVSSSIFIEIEERIFPDGELCPRILISDETLLNGNHVILALQLSLNQCKNEYLISLLWTLYNLKRYNPAKITCIMPYHLYSRQDTEFRVGEPLSSYYLSLALEAAGIDNFVTINTHSYGKGDIRKFFPKSNPFGLSALPYLAKAVKDHFPSFNEGICFSPDEGALLLAKEAADSIGTTHFGAIKKERDRNTGKITQSLVGIDIDIEGHPVIIVDDLVSSGNTMIGAAKILKEKGATEIIFAYIHAVHSSENFARILQAKPSAVFTTDTIKTDFKGLNIVSIVPLLSNWIRKNS